MKKQTKKNMSTYFIVKQQTLFKCYLLINLCSYNHNKYTSKNKKNAHGEVNVSLPLHQILFPHVKSDYQLSDSYRKWGCNGFIMFNFHCYCLSTLLMILPKCNLISITSMLLWQYVSQVNVKFLSCGLSKNYHLFNFK